MRVFVKTQRFISNVSYTISAKSLSQKMSAVEEAKKIAAYTAIDNHVESGNIVGIGSGSTVIYVVERLAQRVQNEKLVITCVPSSFQARQLIVQNNLKLSYLDITPKLDVCFDGADEVDSNLTLIKGGGGCLLQEKIVASCAKRMIIVADYTKNSFKLGEQYKKGIAIEVSPLAYVPIKNRLESQYKGQFVLRMAVQKAGPLVTDSGNFILDWKEFDQCLDWEKVNQEIMMIPGVVETGFFIKMAERAYFGMPDGSVKIQDKLP